MSKFTHLHLHSEFSILDGTIRIPQLVEYLQENGMDSCALTDHGNMYGSFKFHSAMNKAGLKPILGMEIYIAPRSLTQKEAGVDNRYTHLVVLAKNRQGYQNLIKLASIGSLEGFYYKPRVDMQVLAEHSEGLIATTACLGGHVSKYLNSGDDEKAEQNLLQLQEVFKDDLYVEIQRNGIPAQEPVNEKLITLAKKHSLPLVATCDAHYLRKEDSMIQEILWAIADGKTLDDESRRKLDSNEFYVKTPEEMSKLFEDLPEAVENTQEIAGKVEQYDLTFGRIQPHYLALKEGETAQSRLRKMAEEGIVRRFGKMTPELQDRIDMELEIIHDKGYDDYFLVTQEIVQFCRDNRIEVGMRGSGCGSLVAYAIGITFIDPLAWELYFERFLNPERNSPPDFDLDIADRRRDEVIEFVRKRYGATHTRMIGTFGKLQTRAAIRDVSRVLGVSLQVADELSKRVEVVFGKARSIDYMLENDPEFRAIVESDPQIGQMVDIVRKISGMIRGVSQHACGMVITPEPVDTYVPLQKDQQRGHIGMTQYEFPELEDAGLMKFDFLGLRNLSVLGDARDKVEERHGITIDLDTLDMTDEKTFDLICAGKTVGVFQLESPGMRKTIKLLQPRTMEELSYLIAAYRPGPIGFIPEYAAIKNGEKEMDLLFPELEPILGVTNGIITYQEQVIRIAVDFAGYTMGAADKLRKAMGKKKMDIMEAEKPKFISGIIASGYSEEIANELWERLLKFANYGFNKAHSAAYATVSYRTAYLKAHYPLEFMAALLENDLDNFDRIVVDLQECDRMGINVLPPDVNKSGVSFISEGDNAIRFGLAGIKNVGEEAVKSIIKEREENGEYKSIDDFVRRNIGEKLNKSLVENLVKAGATDAFGDRKQILAVLEKLFTKYKKEAEVQKMGQINLFGQTEDASSSGSSDDLPLPSDIHTTRSEKLKWEKELLGIYMTSHPLDDVVEFLAEKKAKTIAEIREINPKSKKLLVVGAMVSTIKRITTKKGDQMAFLTVEDKTGSMEMIAFPSIYDELQLELRPGEPILFAGKLNQREEELSFIIEKAKWIDTRKLGLTFQGITFKINSRHSEEDIKDLQAFIAESPEGDIPVRLLITEEDKFINLDRKITRTVKTKEYEEKFS